MPKAPYLSGVERVFQHPAQRGCRPKAPYPRIGVEDTRFIGGTPYTPKA